MENVKTECRDLKRILSLNKELNLVNMQSRIVPYSLLSVTLRTDDPEEWSFGFRATSLVLYTYMFLYFTERQGRSIFLYL